MSYTKENKERVLQEIKRIRDNLSRTLDRYWDSDPERAKSSVSDNIDDAIRDLKGVSNWIWRKD